MAYTLDGGGPNRPLMFYLTVVRLASVWLHIGAIATPRQNAGRGMMPPPPYEVEDNQQTWLENTDLVFIDPVGTGYFVAKPELASKFLRARRHRIGGRIYQVVPRPFERFRHRLCFGRRELRYNKRVRLPIICRPRHRANGIVLISTVMNFQTLRFANNNDLPLY
jgi:hypothetical protein